MALFAAKSMFFSTLKVYSPRPVASSFPGLKLARCPHSLAPTLKLGRRGDLYLDHSHCLVLAPATLAALPSTRAIPVATCSISLIPFAPFLINKQTALAV